MISLRSAGSLTATGAMLALAGCVASGPLTVIPGQGRSYADLQRDDTACRAAPVAATATTTATAGAASTAAAAPAGDYYRCMQSRGNLLVAHDAAPAYAYGYPAGYGYGYAYPAAYPYYGYPYYAGYPYGGFYGPALGLGIGIGIGSAFYVGHGGYYHHGYGGYRGYRGFRR